MKQQAIQHTKISLGAMLFAALPLNPALEKDTHA